MKKLKNIDFKGLFINHGEKIGMGLVMLIVLTVLATTSWSRTDKTPEQLKTLVATASDKITSPQNVWPATKAEQFALVNFNGQAQEVLAGVSTSKYEFTTPMFWPLYRKKEKAREPDLMVPLYLIAEGGQCVLQVSTQSKGMMDPAGAMAAGTGTAPTATTTESTDSTLKPVAGNPTTAGPTAGPAGAHGGSGPTAPSPLGIRTAQPPQSGPRRPPAPSGGHGSAPPTMEGPGVQMASSGIEARGKRFVAVRAIIPIKEQVERVMKALNLSYAEASSMVEYTDFVLQRQTAIPGPNPWPSDDKWETVNIETALEALRESADFDPDPVPSDLQDAVFTMPLPYRLLRYWGDLATHPNIKQFRLSEEEMQREMKLQAKLVEEAEKMSAQAQAQQGAQKQGFLRPGANGAVVNDMRQMARTAVSSSEGSSMMSSMASYMNEGAGGPRMGAADIKTRLTASGRLYLFRYFDFDVEPGMAYRYRLQLKLKNPNFGRPHEEVEHESVRTGEVRETGFSNISNVAAVPQSVQYFVKDVDRGKKPLTTVSMFEWHSELGTMLADTIEKLAVGNFIGAKKKSLVLDPATPSFEDKEVTFETNDMLVDAASDIEVAVDQHPDLKLKPERSKTARVGAAAEVLVLTNYGELKKLDSGSDVRTEQQLKQGVEEERKGYLYLKDAPKESGSALDGGLYPGTMTPPGTAPMASGGAGPKNPRRRAAGPAGPYGAGPAAPSPAGGTRPAARPRA
ncbi:MAG: hypothetical protein WCJ09_25210 [Planctomycetota bacterium]